MKPVVPRWIDCNMLILTNQCGGVNQSGCTQGLRFLQPCFERALNQVGL
jgi:hypothetical protein